MQRTRLYLSVHMLITWTLADHMERAGIQVKHLMQTHQSVDRHRVVTDH